MSVSAGEPAPDFVLSGTDGTEDGRRDYKLADYRGEVVVLVFYPGDNTAVCTRQLNTYTAEIDDFEQVDATILAISPQSVESHEGWARDIEETQGAAPNYPIIADGDFKVSKLYGMLPASVEGDPAARTPADNQTVRNVFVIGPDKKIKLTITYPASTGRNFDEVLRVIDSLQLTAKHRVSTPVNWKQGEDVIIAGSVSNDEAREIWPEGWEEPKPYIRIVPQPK